MNVAATSRGHAASGASVVIAIPFLDRDRNALELAIRSVFAQTRTDWHLLLVADEYCPELCTLLRRIDDARVTVLADGRNLGLATRLNEIARWCPPGISLMRMDDDDVMLPTRVERQLAALDGPDAVVSSRVIVIDEHTQIMGLLRGGKGPQQGTDFLSAGPVTHPTVVAARDWFGRNPYDETMSGAEDTELWMRVSAHTRFLTVDEPLLLYRVDSRLSIAKNAKASRLHRLALVHHGPAIAGAIRTGIAVLRSVAKQAVFAALIRFNLGGIVYRHKFEPIRDELRHEIQEVLSTVQRTPVPGWANVTERPPLSARTRIGQPVAGKNVPK